jgi:hypothetical protein
MMNVNKKRIAILYSGRTQCHDQVYKRNVSNLIDPLKNAGYEVNLFGSFWDDDDSRNFVESYKSEFKTFETETLTQYTGGVIKNFNEYNNLIKVFNVNEEHILINNTMYWLYKLNRSYNLVKQYERINGITHDYYIRIRPDVTLLTKFDVESLEQLTDNSVMLHVDNIVEIDGVFHGYRQGWIDDNFCVAKKSVFELYCGIYENLVELVNKYQTGIIHVIFKHLFEEQNIQSIRPNSPLLLVKNKGTIIDFILLFTHVYPEKDINKYIKILCS